MIGAIGVSFLILVLWTAIAFVLATFVGRALSLPHRGRSAPHPKTRGRMGPV